MEKAVGGRGEPGLAGFAPGVGRAARSPSGAEAGAACFHCGEPCPGNRCVKGEKRFCCQGCLAVHDLLADAGLGQFYDLSRHPGVNVRGRSAEQRWAYLDEPSVQERLLDFREGSRCRVTFHVPAIHCVACVWLLEHLFRLHPGIGGSRVNFPKREAAITFDADQISLGELAALLASIGYEPRLTLGELERQPANPARKRLWLQVGVAGFAFGNIMLFSIPGYLGLDSFSEPLFKALFGYLSLILALPVLIYSAADYWRSAFLSVRERALTLDVPIAIGLAALYLQSAAEITAGAGLGYLDSLAGLVFFLLCGRAFQQKTFDRITFDRDYRCFFPLSVIRRNAEGETSVAISELSMGDRLLLRHGELIPADCRLVRGDGFIDYSFVTGESEPVMKAVGDYLYAGGKQAGGVIEVETVKPVSQSYLASLWGHEAFRKERVDRLNTLTSRYSRRFTRLVIAVALGSALFWAVSGDLSRGVKAFASVLIVACPCALALAAPFTFGTAQRLLARKRIFLKNSMVLERMAEVDAIVFDKTGTLTSTGPAGAEFRPLADSLSRAERDAAWSLARHSTHPHAVRICAVLADVEGRSVESYAELPGLGIQGVVGGRSIRIGSRAWFESVGVPVPASPASQASLAYLAIDEAVRGVFIFPGAVRSGLEPLLRNLGRRCDLALLSGDSEREREIFQGLFGHGARLAFNQTPLDKLGFVRRLQESDKTVMMVGDGLNDAGALKQSDVGVAVVEKIGAFSPASDIILEGGRVPELAQILTLGRQSARVVRLSFAISALYNVVGVSIAAAGLLSPVVCAVLMPLSSVSVVLFACGAINWAARRLNLAAQNAGDLTEGSAESGLSSRGISSRPEPAVPSLDPQPSTLDAA